jgi:hypothetical protein
MNKKGISGCCIILLIFIGLYIIGSLIGINNEEYEEVIIKESNFKDIIEINSNSIRFDSIKYVKKMNIYPYTPNEKYKIVELNTTLENLGIQSSAYPIINSDLSLKVDKGYIYNAKGRVKTRGTTLPEDKEKLIFYFEILEDTYPTELIIDTYFEYPRIIHITEEDLR